MATKIEDAATLNTAPVEKKSAREAGGKQVGAWFNPVEYNDLREVRFVKRHDKDSDVIKAAVKEYVEKYSAPTI